MSTPQKLRAGKESELTKLKVLWRDSLSEDQTASGRNAVCGSREYWRELFVSADYTQAQIRKQIASELKINLRHDSQLNAFRQWELEQRASDLEAERQAEDERRLTEEFGSEWTLDQIRTEVLKKSYARAIKDGDWAAGRKTIVQDLNVQKVELDRRKLMLLEKKAAAFDKMQEAVNTAKASGGGVTAETLKRIEEAAAML